MGIGQSSTVITLAIVETVKQLGKEQGELGPSVIIGHSAFNLLIGLSVAIFAINIRNDHV